MKIALIAINREGKKLAAQLKTDFPQAKIWSRRMTRRGSLKKFVGRIFDQYDGFVFFAALGITCRLIAPFVKDKREDPAVVSVDTAGRFSISLLSGHEGGANQLAAWVAASLQAAPVITTGREVHKRFVMGIGTRKGIEAETVKRAIRKTLKKKNIGLDAVRVAATVDFKKNEKGLKKACDDLRLPLVFVPKESIARFDAGLPVSKVVRRRFGIDGVCEPCALLAGRRTKLILRKQVSNGVTAAVAEEN